MPGVIAEKAFPKLPVQIVRDRFNGVILAVVPIGTLTEALRTVEKLIFNID